MSDWQGFGTFFAAPKRTREEVMADNARWAAQTTYAEGVADQIITDWQSSGKGIDYLRLLIISAIEGCNE